MNEIKISVPGRICLFGEHQDYLKLPVITAAISRRITISAKKQPGNKIFIDLPDILDSESFTLQKQNQELTYKKERDYFRSVHNIMKREGIHLKNGYHCTVSGNIPINSGTSSSSALIIAWTLFHVLASRINEDDFPPERIARLAYLAEVEEFGEPGGMMDHYSTAIGNTLYIDFDETVKTINLENSLGRFVLGDSEQPKDTKGILGRVKQGVLDAIAKIQAEDASFHLDSYSDDSIAKYEHLLSEAQIPVLEGALINRDITREAKKLFHAESFDHKRFGSLLNSHHEILDKKLNISTKKINQMLASAINAGAYGGKINGSGGGGCMFVYAPEGTERVKRAIEDAAGKAYIINVDDGMKIESDKN